MDFKSLSDSCLYLLIKLFLSFIVSSANGRFLLDLVFEEVVGVTGEYLAEMLEVWVRFQWRDKWMICTVFVPGCCFYRSF